MAKRKSSSIALSPLESELMKVIWERGECRAEDIRLALQDSRDLKDSTVRTLLRRLEAKGALEHSLDGRTFVYRAPVKPQLLAIHAVKSILHRFCGGNVSSLLLGMADDQLVTAEELRSLADKIEAARNAQLDASGSEHVNRPSPTATTSLPSSKKARKGTAR